MSNAYSHLIDPAGGPRTSQVATAADMANYSPHGDDAAASAPPAQKPKKKPKPRSQFAEIAQPEYQTDLANAERYKKRNADRVRYVPPWDGYIVNVGSHWKLDEGKVYCRRLAQAVARVVWAEVGATGTADAIKFAKRTASRSGMDAMIHCAVPDLAINPADLDADPMLLNCRNCTVDLRTGKPRPHQRTDYLTKVTTADYLESAVCPIFDAFLVDVIPSPDVRAFLQRYFGYCLTGSVKEQVIGIFHGCGANGKTTLLNAIQNPLGDYASQAPSSLLTVKKSEQHPTEIASLFGKRLVVASETEAGERLAESLVKSLTGGDPITARRMRENFWTFLPTHKLILGTNNKPKIRGRDHAIWRRILLVPFNEVFDGSRKDPTLPEKLASEASGILRWCVEGCLAWQRDGLNPPEEVRAAVREYRSSEDTIGRFVRDVCVVGSSDFTVKFSDLYAALERWCDDTGDNRPGRKTVGQWLLDNGLEQYQSGVSRYRGIGLKAE